MENSNDLIYKIALSFIPNIGSANAKKLISVVGDPKDVFNEKINILSKINGIGKKAENLRNKKQIFEYAEREIKFLKKNNYKYIFYLDKEYPHRLKNCEDAPVNLFCSSDFDFNKQKIISIVGTRNATNYGINICERLITELAENNHNVTIVSGLAYGIDVCAHSAALKNNLDTIAVMGTGLNRIYPALHKKIAYDISKQGTLLTEFTSQIPPEKSNFARRNKIVAGISDATIVVESGIKGGSLITADIANSYNRDVFAFPGKVNDKQSVGCNKLIKENKAALIESYKDLEYILGWETNKNSIPKQRELFVNLNKLQNKIVDLLKKTDKSSIDYISIKLNIPISKLSTELIDLEFKGVLICLPGNIYKLI